MMIIPPYHKGGEKSLLHEIPVLFNFVTFALSSIQWPACRAEGRIIGFGVLLLAYENSESWVTSDNVFSTVIAVPNGHLSTHSKPSP